MINDGKSVEPKVDEIHASADCDEFEEPVPRTHTHIAMDIY
jgi:hypothetical protein